MNRTRFVALSASVALGMTAATSAAVLAQDEETEPVRIGFVTHVLGSPALFPKYNLLFSND
jgi:ABC-type sugar transport system substrate-binding protein